MCQISGEIDRRFDSTDWQRFTSRTANAQNTYTFDLVALTGQLQMRETLFFAVQ